MNFVLNSLSTLLLAFVVLCIKIQSFDCKSSCKLTNPNAKEEALLEDIKLLYGKTLETKDFVNPANYSYKISICGKIDGQNEGIGAVQYTSTNETYTLGRSDKVEITNGTNWLRLIYSGGAKYHEACNKSERVTEIMIICDPTVLVGTLQILEERKTVNCHYLFEFGSSVSCSESKKLNYQENPDHKGYSSGSIFCILFFTFASAYLLIGFLYKRLVVGAKGMEQIPNYSFWKDFGNLQADGCDYICRCGPRQESQAYRGIDDHLKMEDERDDQLLNM